MCKLCNNDVVFGESELHICENVDIIPNNLSYLFFLNCTNNKKITEFPDSLKYINNINLSGCTRVLSVPVFEYLVNLNISFTFIDHIPNKLVNLNKIECEGCVNLTKLPFEFNKVYFLKCTGTPIDAIPDTYVNLLYLYIGNTNVFDISPKIKKIKYLDCQSFNHNIQLMNLHKKYNDIIYLNCCNNNIPIIGNYSSLKYLNCSKNPIYKLNKGICQLEYLDCSETFLTKFDNDLRNILFLNISNTEIKELPIMPYITTLLISNTPIKVIPDCCENLTKLDCSFTCVEVLPTSILNSNKLTHLNCANSNMNDFPSKLTNLQYIDITKSNIVVNDKNICKKIISSDSIDLDIKC